MFVAKNSFAAVIIAYPVIVYFGLGYFEARLIALALIVVAVARFFLGKRLDSSAARLPHGNLVIGALLLVISYDLSEGLSKS